MTYAVGTDAGLELIGRQIALVLVHQLNEEIAVQESAWQSLDEEFYSLTGITNSQPITLERVPATHIYIGHIPTLIDAPPARYPNVSILPFSSRANGKSIDLYHGTSVTVQIDVMCKAGPYPDSDASPSPGEEFVNKRTQRTVEAVAAVMTRNQNLEGLTTELSGPPSIELSDVFGKHLHRDKGPRYWWQGGRLEYRFDRLVQAF